MYISLTIREQIRESDRKGQYGGVPSYKYYWKVEYDVRIDKGACTYDAIHIMFTVVKPRKKRIENY